MSNLLGAGFARLRRSKCLWFCLAFLIVWVIVAAGDRQMTQTTIGKDGEVQKQILYEDLEKVVFSFLPYLGFVVAIFTGIYMGAEYGEGTLRNKLIAGYGRGTVYLAEAVVCASAAAILCGGALAVGTPVLLLMGFKLSVSPGVFLGMAVSGVLSAAACSGIALLVVTQIQRGRNAMAAGILVFFLLVVLAAWLDNRLEEKEALPGGWMVTEEGEIVPVEAAPNPRYVADPLARTAMELLEEVLPVGQGIRISNRDLEHMERWPPLSLAVTFAATGAGALLFRKKDIR